MSLPVRVMRFSGVALTIGVEEHVIEGVPVRIYGPAKTVADCFRYRNKIGFDVALEALRDCYRMRLATVDELYECAGLLRVGNVMRPYIKVAAVTKRPPTDVGASAFNRLKALARSPGQDFNLTLIRHGCSVPSTADNDDCPTASPST